MISAELKWSYVGLRWSQLISSDLGQYRVIPGDLKLSQVFWTALQKPVDIFSDFTRSEVTSGDVKSCQFSIIKYQMIWGDLSRTEVILRDLRRSQLTSSDVGQCRVIPGDLRLFQVFWTALQKSVDIFSDFTRSEVTSGDVKSCPFSIIKYQMIWGDLSWTELILGDLRWSQLISSDLGQCRVIPGDLRLSKVFWTAREKSVDIFSDFRRSEVTSRDVKSCQFIILTVSDDLRWSQLNWGDLTRDLRWSQLISSDLGQYRVIPGDLKLSQVFWTALQKPVDIFSDFTRSEVTSGDVKSCQVVSLSIRWSEVISAELRWSYVILGDHSWPQVMWDNVGWSQVISGSPKYFELHCKNLWIFSVISQDLRWPQVMSSHSG